MESIRSFCAPFLPAMFIVFCAGAGAVAEDAAWRVTKSSGDVRVTTSGVQEASLNNDAVLKPGDNIRTGPNGRVLLVRGEETILISPNSLIGIPAKEERGLSTTILQQAGTILIAVEKRNDKHFEVKTPHLVAAVKGTQFRITVNKNESHVDVLKGQVEVAEFKSSRFVLVLPGQTAKVSEQGPGLSVRGSGALNPIQSGNPRASSVMPVQVVQEGLTAPAGQRVRTASPSEVESAPTLLGGNAANENGRGSDLNSLGRQFGNPDDRGNRKDGPFEIIAVTFAIGFSVAVAVAAQRRRRKQKQERKFM